MQNSLVIGQQPRRDPQPSSRNQRPMSEPSSKSQPPLTNAASSLSPMASRQMSQSSPKQSLQISECGSLPSHWEFTHARQLSISTLPP